MSVGTKTCCVKRVMAWTSMINRSALQPPVVLVSFQCAPAKIARESEMQGINAHTVSSIAHVLFVIPNYIYSIPVDRTARKHGGYVALSDLKANSLLLFIDQAYVR